MRSWPTGLCLFGCLMTGCAKETTTYAAGVVASFEATAEVQPDQGTARIRQSTEHATHGKYSLEVSLDGSESGLGLGAPTTWDFTGASKLLLDIYRDGLPIGLNCRFFDANDKPYVVWYYRLEPGSNLVEIDLTGLAQFIDPARVKRMYFYVDEGSGRIFIDNVRLSSQPVDLEATLKRPESHPKRVPNGNGLLNGDFEVGLAGWGSWGEWDDGKYLFSSGVGAEACSGSASLKIICEKPGRGGVFTDPMFMPEGTYQFRFWARGEGNDARMRWTFEGDANSRALVERNFESDVISLGPEWREFRYEVPIRGNAALRLYFFSLGSGTVLIDAASLVLVGKEERPPYKIEPAGAPSQITVQGNRFFQDGKPFFPLGIYMGKPSMLKGTGFNCQMPSAVTPEVFDESIASQTFVTPELTGVLRAHLPWQVGIAMEPFKGHPHLFGWYLCDEPDHVRMTVPPPELRLASKFAKRMDPDRLTWAVVMSWADSNMFQYADTVDVLATDIYPIDDVNAKRPLVEVAHKTDTLMKAVGPNKPGIAVLQATPKATPAEEYAMTYLALTHGANGLFYWQLYDIFENPAAWGTMTDLSLEVAALSPVLTAPDYRSQAKVSDPKIHQLTRRIGNRLYILSVNESPDPVAGVEFSHEHVDAAAGKVLFERRDIPVKGTSWRDNFAGYERHVYSIPAR